MTIQAETVVAVTRRIVTQPGQSHVTNQACDVAAVSHPGYVTPVVSLFPGIDLLGMGFEQAGFCVLRGPDTMFGGDIRQFHIPPHVFTGVIGGSPCQDFSKLRRTPPTGNGLAMLAEYKRIVLEAKPLWWLLENVPQVPDMMIDGYSHQRLDLRANEFGLTQSRLRHFQFGHRDHVPLIIPRQITNKATEPCCLASEGTKSNRRSWADFCQLQGLPRDFALPSFTQSGRYRAVGNGVPLPMAYAIAIAIQRPIKGKPCACSCGRPVTSKASYANASCRKRAQRKRDRVAAYDVGHVTAQVTQPGTVTPAQSQKGQS